MMWSRTAVARGRNSSSLISPGASDKSTSTSVSNDATSPPRAPSNQWPASMKRVYLACGLEMDAFQREQDRIATETEALSARTEPEPDLQFAPTVVERAFAIIDNIPQAYLRANERERAMWNEAVFAGIWVGDREIKRTEYRDLFASILSDSSSNWVSLVAPAGFEPAISALKGLRPGPLDDGGGVRRPRIIGGQGPLPFAVGGFE